MTDNVTVTIDGVPYEMPNGMNLVDAALTVAGTAIPIFCYHPKINAVGNCRMCLVEMGFEARDRETGELQLDEDGAPQVRWWPKLETACTNTVRPGMHLRTTSERVVEGRKAILEFLLSSHPLDCPICDKGGECPLQTLTMRYGPSNTRMVFTDKLHLDKHVPLGDLIFLDRERCIQCARCIRFQDIVVGDDVLAFHERGRHLQIITDSRPPFDTYFSGNTTDICPVGALTTADFRFGARPWELKDVPSISPHGPVGENIVAGTRLDSESGGVVTIKRILPRQNDDVNEIWISDKTRFGHHFTMSPDRLQKPLVRKKGELAEVSWDDALKAAAKQLKEAGNKVGFIGGLMTTNEDFYAMREMAEGIGSRKLGLWPPNLGDHEPVAETGIASGSRFSEMGQGDAILVIASDLEEEAPIWFLQAKQAADRGATLVVANTRCTKLDRYAAETIHYEVGDAVTVLNSLLATAISKKWVDNGLIKDRVNGFDDLAAALKGMDQPHKDAAAALAQAENLVICAGNDGLEPEGHSALLQAAANFLIASGHVGQRNNGLLPIWPGANTQGGFDLGFESSDTRAMLKNLPDVLVVAGANIADCPHWREALDKAGFVIYLTLFPDATTEQADVVLPIQSFAERQGTFTNAMRRVQRFYEAHGPVGDSLPVWRVIAMLGQHLDQAPPRPSVGLVMKAITENVKHYKDMTYGALAHVAEQTLPLGESPDHYGGSVKPSTGGTGVQWESKAEGRGKLTVKAVEAAEKVTLTNEQLLFVPVRRLYDTAPEFYASELMHGRIPEPFVSLNYVDAVKQGIHDGDMVKIEVGGGGVTAQAIVNGYAPEGVAFLPLRLSDDPLPQVPLPGTLTVVERAEVGEESAEEPVAAG